MFEDATNGVDKNLPTEAGRSDIILARKSAATSNRRAIEQIESPVSSWMPETQAERNAIREQLERLLANPLFKHSRRYPSMLRYVVEHALFGDSGQLKERTLGIEVFARDPHYDTNLDPVVRTTAGEIRKRIAQYYHEPGHEGEVRIDLPARSGADSSALFRFVT